MKTILLAGPSASGKSTLANALRFNDARVVVSTSAHLRRLAGPASDRHLAEFGGNLDASDPTWVSDLVKRASAPCVIDAIRSPMQEDQFDEDVIRVNVLTNPATCAKRAAVRGRGVYDSGDLYFAFENPTFSWDSSKVSLSTAVNIINQLGGGGSVDIIVGGQYGSEGKGKLAALLANRYDMLVRTGGPNAGHWVRDRCYEYCFHHLPSGSLANPRAQVVIAAGATLGPKFMDEVHQTGVLGRLVIDPNAMIITDDDRIRESKLVDIVGSTAQGVGACAARRVLRGLIGSVETAADDPVLSKFTKLGPTSRVIADALSRGDNVMLEGTQGSALSLFHGPFPYTTSRDTNLGGLLAEIGVPASAVRDTWMVCRSFPIRVGGNSGPMHDEISWEAVADHINTDPVLLKSRELTSTTKRQRRVGTFDWDQLRHAAQLNRPSKLFLSFADYLHPSAARVNAWGNLPDQVLSHVEEMEKVSGALVAGISTGPNQDHVVWRAGHE